MTDESCYSHLISVRWANGFSCPSCRHSEYYEIPVRKLFQCKKCQIQTSGTSGTIMHRTRTPLRFWFWGIYCIDLWGGEITAKQLSREIELNYHASRRMLSKINGIEVDNGFLSDLLKSFDGMKLPAKESRIDTQPREEMGQKINTGTTAPTNTALKTEQTDEFFSEDCIPFDIPGYKVTEKMSQTARELLFRGYRQSDKKQVIIKTSVREHLFPADYFRLRHEYDITKELSITGIIKPLAFEMVEGRPFLILPDSDVRILKNQLLLGKLETSEFLSVAIFLAEILVKLQDVEIIHKDINPNHVFIHSRDGQVQLSGFCIATSFPKENPDILSHQLVQGTLAYISPEQSGRMNRSLDYRTDFYSLGVTLYEAITGQHPFPVHDPLEMIHSHIAKQPAPPHQLNPNIPQVVSEIIMKLMAKTADDRYQTAAGLSADLRECQSRMETTGRIDRFPLGRQDVSERMQMSEGLYGREAEAAVLLELFENVSKGKQEIVMVSGYSGIGKTSLVKEQYRSTTEKNGFFISGKFDQYRRNIPYSALIEAFDDLINDLLSADQEVLETWKDKLIGALGTNGQIILEVIPELEKIIGPQSPVLELGPAEAQNRFHYAFSNFINVFCDANHPMVIFLDDLQWVDSVSLKFIEHLGSVAACNYLLLIGAYRDNEVNSSHPLHISLEKWKKEDVHIHHLRLHPLQQNHVAQLIADTVKADTEVARDLSDLVFDKTGGNPFFMNQFLLMLTNRKILVFDLSGRKWRWELSRVHELGVTDNVVELLITRLKNLAPQVQAILQIAACIGSRFDLHILGILADQPQGTILERLMPALREDLVISLTGASHSDGSNTSGETVQFRFQHDRVQQAAYALTEKKDLKKLHRRIGLLLNEKLVGEQHDERLFDILHHLNQSIDLVRTREEKDKLARLNLAAGRKSIAAFAFEPALDYLKIGLSLIGKSGWSEQYDITLALHKEAVKASCCAGLFEEMESIALEAAEKARHVLDKSSIFQNRIISRTIQDKLPEAVEITRDILGQLGTDLFEYDSLAKEKKDFDAPMEKLRGKKIMELLELPDMTDPIKLAASEIMFVANIPIYFSRSELLVSINTNEINTLLDYGNNRFGPFFYCSYGSMLCWINGDIDAGYKFGRMGMKLMDRFGANECRSRTIHTYYLLVMDFKHHMRE
ncbi:MAG: AAA family ATPase, partial [Deltaproteobacteria bacterium]|nr:AAA family ATPase [Deltaproteobacteria bacterium]